MIKKNEFKTELLMTKAYNEFKDVGFANSYDFRDKCQKKYDLDVLECSKVYAMVIRHQVRKYGCNLAGSYGKDKKIYKKSDFKKKVYHPWELEISKNF